MIITILILVEDPKQLEVALKPAINNIENCGYPKGKIEVVFLILSQEDKGSRTFEGVPVVKIRYYKDRKQALNDGITKALGNLIVFGGVKTRFQSMRLLTAAKCFEQNIDLGLFREKGWDVIPHRKPFMQFPSDLICLRTYLLADTLCRNSDIIGPWGEINRKEVLRFIYKMDKVGFINRFKLFWRSK